MGLPSRPNYLILPKNSGSLKAIVVYPVDEMGQILWYDSSQS